MSFNYFARKVRNPRLDLCIRYSALGSCIIRLGWLKGQRYSVIRDRFAPWFGREEPRLTSVEPLLDALVVMERERNAVLERLRAFERRRIRQKMRGHRQLSTAEERALREALTGEATGDTP